MIATFSKTLHGVYPADAFPDDCLALFKLREDAESFAAAIAGCDVVILETTVAAEFENPDVATMIAEIRTANRTEGKPMSHKRRWIQTNSGRAFFPLAPTVAMIRIEDIAHALAMKCRFTGHVREFYSVAQHSVIMSRHVTPAVALWALLHDAGEAYLPDVARPIKDLLFFKNPNATALFKWDSFEMAEQKIMHAVAEFAGLAWPMPLEVKRADARMLATERRDLMTKSTLEWAEGERPFAFEIEPVDWREAETMFLARFEEIIGAKS